MRTANATYGSFPYRVVFFACIALAAALSACGWGIKDVGVAPEDADAGDADAVDGLEADVIEEDAADVPEEDAADLPIEDISDAPEEDAADLPDADGPGWCGNGFMEGDEECDDGDDNSDTEPDACRTDCTLPRCGDLVTDSEEECDDGQNGDPADGCTDECLYSCHENADCDDSEPCNGDETCNPDSHTCEEGSPLDDGHVCDNDPRSICLGEACVESLCGDGFVDTGGGESCEPPGEGGCSDSCRWLCDETHPCPDDGNICNGEETCNLETHECESTDPPPEGTVCNEDPRRICISETCQESMCGDGYTDVVTGEECDDERDGDPADGCTDECLYSCHADADCDDGEICNGGETCGPVTSEGRVCEPGTDAPPGTSCDDGLFCTLTDECDGSGTCVGTGSPCDDGLDCTTDSCDESTDTCSNDPDAGYCVIDGTCYTDGEDNPLNECQACVTSSSQTSWTNKSSGTTCTDDGASCTADECDGLGNCVHPVSAGYCYIGGICFDDGTDNPANECQACDESSSRTAWTDKPSGTSCSGDGVGCTVDECDGLGSCAHTPDDSLCSDGFDCTTDTCDAMAGCSSTIDPGWCLIGSTCYSDSEDNPANDCQWCIFTSSQTSWTNKSSGTPCAGDGVDCTVDECDGLGSCDHTSDDSLCDDGRTCTTDTCDAMAGCSNTVDPGWCLIGGTCYADGADNPLNECQECNAAASQTSWTNKSPGDPCTDDGAGCTVDECDGAGNCTHVIAAGWCFIVSTCYADGTDNPLNECQECDAATSQTAWTNKSSGTPCSGDGVDCTVDECNGLGACTHTPDDSLCDDGFDCTTDTCDVMAGCTSTIDAGWCLIGGICYSDGDDNPANDCQECVSSTSQTSWTNKSMGDPCAGDGVGCTVDECDGAGTCVSTPDDGLCIPPDLCLPDCRLDATGCVTPPGYLDLTCTSPVTPPAASDCTIDLDGLGHQALCLSCDSEVGIVLLDYSDFGDDTGACDPDGWTLATGNACSRNVNGCTPGGGSQNCCADFSSLCNTYLGGYYLQSAQNFNCGGGYEQWRLEKTFDTTGLTGLELCFELGDWGADANEGVLAYASDAVNNQQVFCLNGGPQPNVDGVFYPYCVSLDAWPWTADNPNLTITFIAHSEDNWDFMYLDTISLRGWRSTCGASYAAAFSDDFGGCLNPIPDGWNGWTVTGDPKCPGFECLGGAGDGWGAEADNEAWTMTHAADASGLDGNVTLCFDLGDDGSGGGDSVLVEFDAGRGAGWETAWTQADDLGTNQQCRTICVNLSDIDPDVNRNPDLRIRFSVDTTPGGGKIDIDDIEVSGAVYCDGAGSVTLGPISDDTGGFYSFTAVDDDGSRLDADIHCTWDSPPSPIEDWSHVQYIP